MPAVRTGRLLVVLGLAALAPGCRPDTHPRPHEVRIVPAADAAAGRAALRDYGCIQCHIIPGVRGANGVVGPPLTAFARRTYIAGRLPNRSEDLILFLMNPEAIKPGSAMPAVGLDPQDARDIAAYLYTLR